MPARTPAFILLLIVAFPSSAPALGFEYLGNARVESQGGWSTAFMNAVNNSKRVYGYEVNGNPTFFFHGDANDLNEAIVQFAAIPAEHREIVLLPGRGRFGRSTVKPRSSTVGRSTSRWACISSSTRRAVKPGRR